ncbi:hypothetical protein ACSMX9_07900 [Streptomyces sp. LE64]|uniref:hypothetical protein n=1 Tax=Streptomyces sp. LE64 TaxID=3448653 RepID=UPI004041F2AD
MSRIRTIKPEAFESEDLAAVSVTAALTFFGLLTQADDSGRFRDNAAIVTGRLWALRPGHTAADVEEDLRQLAETGLICRYTCCDGRTWLHIVTWERHQKINRPSESRLPRCPAHQAARHCGRCRSSRCPADSAASPPPADDEAGRHSVNPHGGLTRTDSSDSASNGFAAGALTRLAPPPGGASTAPEDGPASTARESAGQTGFHEASSLAHGDLGEGSPPGSRILDPGSVPMGRPAPTPSPVSPVSSTDLVSEYVANCVQRPPREVIRQVERQTEGLLGEGFEPGVLRVALDRLRTKSLHPRTLPSLVNEVVNTPAKGGNGPRSAPSAHVPFFNPDPPTGSFGIPKESASGD